MSPTVTRIRIVSLILSWLCLIAIICELCFVPLIWLTPDFARDAVSYSDSLIPIPLNDLQSLAGVQLAVVFITLMVPSLVLVFGLWHLRKMFLCFARNAIFEHGTIRHLKIFSIALLSQTLLSPLAGTLTSLFVTITRPEGERAISIGLSNIEATSLFLGGLFLIISWVLGEAVSLHDENRSFV
ncbi:MULTISPECIES: DUF2975 domain-containing protein [unclassified Thalassospira]|uniref:DUF2975 domain-containing protein n=1 Tax=unclassified Thalassospira TaxID=2648997 RepID=UPI000A1FB99B|nr:DUF2975 domain-containing protein [Thalassospira sp. MCCC 1A01428]OSQ44703.1 hypothetical protein THS27_05895 [Thalassospira sp. MCCC 1A01428]